MIIMIKIDMMVMMMIESMGLMAREIMCIEKHCGVGVVLRMAPPPPKGIQR